MCLTLLSMQLHKSVEENFNLERIVFFLQISVKPKSVSWAGEREAIVPRARLKSLNSSKDSDSMIFLFVALRTIHRRSAEKLTST